jgi:dihydroxyacetone kinase
MNAQALKKAFNSISQIMDANRDYLIQLDQQNGDGDLGVSMSAGFKAVSTYLSSEDKEKDLGILLMKCSGALNEGAPSSLGTILSIGLIGMAKALKGKEEASIDELAKAMERGINEIMKKAKSKPGEKTILDALCPAVDVLKSKSDMIATMAFAAAVEAAAAGSEATKKMKSIHGRAAYYAEKSIGILDGGSVVGKLIFEGIRASIL